MSCALIVILSCTALGIWQVQRLFWKQDLIARTEARVRAAPEPAPAIDTWPGISTKRDEYRHVSVTGFYLPEQSVRVQAVTDLGAGFWLLTALRQADGAIVLINRGFVLARQGSTTLNSRCAKNPVDSSRPITITGLLRINEPDGAFLRNNDPLAQRWYSRDVVAIGRHLQLTNVAPFFIDADADPDPAQRIRPPSADCPIGGLTVVSFSNNHLVYAVTWFALALMIAGAVWWSARSVHRSDGHGDGDEAT